MTPYYLAIPRGIKPLPTPQLGDILSLNYSIGGGSPRIRTSRQPTPLIKAPDLQSGGKKETHLLLVFGDSDGNRTRISYIDSVVHYQSATEPK
jgi:hypothetical protein